jgi:hypothetical protein
VSRPEDCEWSEDCDRDTSVELYEYNNDTDKELWVCGGHFTESMYRTSPSEIKEIRAEQLEELADLEHRQWMHWSKYVAENYDIPEKLEQKWIENWKPYDELSEEMKEKDRNWARKAMKIIGILNKPTAEGDN